MAVLLGQVGNLRVGELQAPGDVIGVFEQDLPGAGQLQPAAPTVKRPNTDLGLEQRDLVRHRGFGEREHLSGP